MCENFYDTIDKYEKKSSPVWLFEEDPEEEREKNLKDFVRNNYELCECLKTSKYSMVWIASKLDTSEKVVIKVIRYRTEAFPESQCLKMMGMFKAPHIVKMKDKEYFPATQLTMLELEYVPGTHFAPESINELRILIYQLLEALSILHKFGWLHGDLKPSNLIVSNSHQPKLKVIDFGLATKVKPPTKIGYRGTLPYIAPEIISGDIVSVSADMWSVGVIMAEIIIGKKPLFSTEDKDSTFQEAVEIDLSFYR
jgi:serine/threonine protein kinase